MRDLTEAGRSVVEQPPAPPTPIERIEAMATSRRRRGRIRAAAALVTAVALVGGAVVVARERTPTNPTAAPTPHVQHHRTGPAPRPPIIGQIRAHNGVGVPRGWVPVDYGDARLWVPPSWKVLNSRPCPDASQALTPNVTYVLAPSATCGTPSIVITSLPLQAKLGSRHRMIHDYSVVYSSGPATPRVWSVPALHVEIRTSGGPAVRVLDTLAPSTRGVALDTSTQPVPNDWQRIYYNGLSVAVPSSWATRLGANQPCLTLLTDTALAGIGNQTSQCQLILANVTPHDGVWLDTGFGGCCVGPGVPSYVVHGNWVKGMTVREVEAQDTSPIIDLMVQVGKQVQFVEIGVGADWQTANRVLHSLTVTPHTDFASTGCPPKPGTDTLPGSSTLDPRQHIVPDNPVSARLCVYSTVSHGADQLAGAKSLDAPSTAKTIDSRPGYEHCQLFADPLIAELHFGYLGRHGHTPVSVQVGRCITGNGLGAVATPNALWQTIQGIGGG